MTEFLLADARTEERRAKATRELSEARDCFHSAINHDLDERVFVSLIYGFLQTVIAVSDWLGISWESPDIYWLAFPTADEDVPTLKALSQDPRLTATVKTALDTAVAAAIRLEQLKTTLNCTHQTFGRIAERERELMGLTATLRIFFMEAAGLINPSERQEPQNPFTFV